jgi:HYR domain-containing protein
MRRPTAFSAFFNLLKTASAGALVLATVVSCSDSMSPTANADGVIRVKVSTIDIVVPDSVKQGLAVEGGATRMVPLGPSMSALSSPVSYAGAAASALSCGGGGAFQGYTKSRVAFAPEAIPNIAPYPLKDDGIIPDKDVPLGFSFSFQGNTYDRVNVYMNGFLLFGPLPSLTNGYPDAGFIASLSNPNNILALAWTDWQPNLVPDGIRFETRGTAPNRRFILQFNNVPEYYSSSRVGAIVPSAGRLMSQVVLSEGSNDITIYTNSMNVTNSRHFVTQGIENSTGTDAMYDSVFNAVTGITSARVHNFFKLENDAVRFSLIQTKDEEKPSITAPENVIQGNDPGLASAVVAVGVPAASDNCSNVKVSGVRSDGLALEAPYPVGVTSITWTATDDAGNAASAVQTIKVEDREAPVFAALAQSVFEINATSPSGALVNYELSVTDNVRVTSVSCEPASGSLFPVGSTEVHCSASDAAGNSASKSLTVKVIGWRQQVEALVAEIKDLSLPNGTSNPLLNQLKAALQENGNECKKVADFIDMVHKKGSSINDADEEAMIADALRIQGALGCNGGSAQVQSVTLQTSRSAMSDSKF